MLYIRLLNAPFTPMNYGLSLTKVHFKDFFLGTGLGVMVSVFAITFLSGMIRDAWISGRWSDLLSLKVLFGVFLYGFSFFIPLILKKIKGNRRCLRNCDLYRHFGKVVQDRGQGTDQAVATDRSLSF